MLSRNRTQAKDSSQSVTQAEDASHDVRYTDAKATPLWANNQPVQLKSLRVNQPDDPYERQANAIARQVMRSSTPDSTQTASTSAQSDAVYAPQSVNKTLNRSGQAMDETTRTDMQSRFGIDFSNVRIHTDSEAKQSASAVQAKAYTVGNDIVFGEGQYQPRSQQGRELIAHELVHVLQQSRGQAQLQRQSIHNPLFPCEGTSLLAGGTAFVGTWVHILIQQHYVSMIDPMAAAEYAIPGSSLSGADGRADIVDSSGGVYEIKPFGLIAEGFAEAENYTVFAELNCDPSVNWHLGTTYYYHTFYYNGEIIATWLAMPGVIAYLRMRPQEQEQEQEQEQPERRRIPVPDESFMEKMETITGLTGAALITYIIISEGSRLFPPRNLVPVP